MLRLNHEDRLEAIKDVKFLPKPNGTKTGTHPHDYNLNLVTAWLLELTTLDMKDMHIETTKKMTPAKRKKMAEQLMERLYSLGNHVDAHTYASMYYHISSVLQDSN